MGLGLGLGLGLVLGLEVRERTLRRVELLEQRRVGGRLVEREVEGGGVGGGVGRRGEHAAHRAREVRAVAWSG